MSLCWAVDSCEVLQQVQSWVPCLQCGSQTQRPAVQVRTPTFPEIEGPRGLYPRCPQQDENKQPAGLRVSNSAKPFRSLRGQHAGREQAL